LYSSSFPTFSTPYRNNGPYSLNVSAAFGAQAAVSTPMAGFSAQSAFYAQALQQSLQGLHTGWGSFAGMQQSFGGYGSYGSFGGLGSYGSYGSFGGHGSFSGHGLSNRFGVGGYGPPQSGPFDPFCPPGFGWHNASVGGQLNLQFGYQEVPGENRKMWDVWFDSKDGQKTVQRSPIVLDLNNNGKADITGKNITGDGVIDGPTTLFDLDPNSVSYEAKSQQRRPGSGAPAVNGGYWVDANGNKVKGGVPKGTQKKFAGYQYLDKNGTVVGEMKNDGLYHYGKKEHREITEWLAKDGGDGFLVHDIDGDGQINSAIELFGTEGANGEKYKNGYEKLAALYDRNRDGKVSGDELAGLQIWVDSNADGVVQEGELQSLQQHNITSFDVSNYNGETMEGSYTVGGGVAPYFNLSANVFGGYGYGYSQPNYGYAQPSYGYGQPSYGYGQSGYPAASGY